MIQDCTLLRYQESPIRHSDYTLLERTPLMCIQVQPFFDETYDGKYPIVITESTAAGWTGPHLKNVTAKVHRIWGTTEMVHPTRALAERFVVDLNQRFPNKQFVVTDPPPHVNRCPIPSEQHELRFVIRTRIWDLRMVDGSSHLQYFARAQLSDLHENRTVWEQTCGEEEIWPQVIRWQTNGDETTNFIKALQIHAQSLIDQCSVNLVKHLDPLG